MKRLSLLAIIMIAWTTQAVEAQYYPPHNQHTAAQYYNGYYRPQYPHPYYRMPVAAYPVPRPYSYHHPRPIGYLPPRGPVSGENPYYRNTSKQPQPHSKGSFLGRLVGRNAEKESPTRQVSTATAPPEEIITDEPRIPDPITSSHQPARPQHHPQHHLQGNLGVLEEIAPSYPELSCPDGGCEEACVPACETCPAPKKRSKPRWWQKFGVHGSFLYLTARDADVPLGQPFNGDTAAATGIGSVAVADPDYAPAFRAGGSYHINEFSSIEGTFWWFQSNTTGSFQAPEGTSFRNFLLLPQTPLQEGNAMALTSRYDIDFLIADGHFRGSLYKGCRGYLDYLVGGRYAHLDQDLEVVGTGLGARTVRSTIDFDGGGPRLGLDGGYYTKCGVFVYGRGMLSLLAGHFGAKWQQLDADAGVEGITEIGDDRIVPITELEVGVGWVSPKGRVRVSGGYYVAAWFNTITQPSLTNSIQGAGTNPNFTHNGDNFNDTLVFDGLVGSIEVRY